MFSFSVRLFLIFLSCKKDNQLQDTVIGLLVAERGGCQWAVTLISPQESEVLSSGAPLGVTGVPRTGLCKAES